MKNNNIFRQFFRNAPFPCVHHEILRNDQGRHEDYRFIGVNEAFTRLINTRHKKLDGLTVRQVLSGPGSKDSGLTGLYEKIFERNGIAALEHFFPGTGEWYTVNAWQTDGSHIAVSFTDVTERKQAEKERESAMLILQSALAQSPSGILIADAPDVTIRWANEAALGIRGDSELPLTGIDVSKHSISWQTLRLDGTPVPSEELPLSRAILKGETVCNEEVIIRHASGEDRYVSANSAPIRDSSGEIRAGIVVFHDITERKHAEEQLKASEKKYRELSTLLRLLADNMPDMLWAKNLKKEYIFANKSICNNLLNARDTEEPLGKTDMFFALRERQAQPENPGWHTFGEICRDSDSITVEEMKPLQFDEFGNVQGKFLFLDVHKAPLYDNSGQLIGVVGSARDVTERKRLEESLKHQTKFLELLMEISSGFINIPLINVEASIQNSLEKLGTFVDADRAYIFEYNWKEEKANNTYEWCNSGISPEIENLQDLPLSLSVEMVECHKLGKILFIHDVNNLPEGTTKELYQSQDILSLVTVPMMDEGACIGFVGFDSVKQHKEYSTTELQLLEFFARILVNINLRKEILSQLVKAKIAAETSDEKHRTLIEQMLEGLIVDDRNGLIRFVNPMFCKMTGFREDELLGKSGYELLLQKDDIYKMRLKDEERKRNIADQYELNVVTKSGEIRTFWFHATPVLDKQGTFAGSMSTVTDITERKKTETVRKIQSYIARLIHTAETMEELLENIRQELGKIIDTTNFFVAIYNKERNTLKQLIFCDEMDSFEEWDANQSVSGQVVKSGKTIFLRGDEISAFSQQHNLEVLGTDPACWLGVPLVIQNQAGGVMVLQHYHNPDAYKEADVALFEMVAHETGIFLEKKLMIEDLVLAKNKAEESDRLKTHFMNNISHEIRTPLNGIIGFGDLMMDETLTPEEKQYYHHILHHSSNRLQQTVTDIMDIAELRAGSLRVNLGNMDIRKVLNRLADETRFACSQKNIVVTLDLVPESEEIILRTDEELFSKILRHLLGNAVKFTDKGRITVGFRDHGNRVECFVKDTGKGISADKLETIFEPFMQEDVLNTRGHEGSGLGLTIARGMVSLIGGTIRVESVKGEGSTFFFTLPQVAILMESESPKSCPPDSPDSGDPVVLIAEDDESSAQLVQVIIQKAGLQTLLAWNGEEAVGLCHQYPEISLVFMDIKMPVMNGLEATARIKEFRPDLPVIALTAHAQSGDRTRMLEAGCDDYIAKPLIKSTILDILQKFKQIS